MKKLRWITPALLSGVVCFTSLYAWTGNGEARDNSGKIGVCCYSGLAERNAEYHVNSIFYRS